MTVALDDVVLVLLAEGPSSAYELWQRHTAVFGEARKVDLSRVMISVNRLERAGLIRIEAPATVRHGSANRLACWLTAEGRRRQAAWLCAVGPDTAVDDLYVRGMLAVDAANPATFDTFLASGLAATRLRISRLATAGDHDPALRARAAFDQEVARALALWLNQLPEHRRPGQEAGTVPG
ncbi:PadR family transcriptional regulator [Dactylosporangium sp. NPDC049140]|jgi:DNA-binding PadR family transcriptional regulator|uniref:PadR family transcriptional regulator n=1 Tax=Dactylosporangium sp. NPDC049140 TaxID=3155647 RepID=UPI0033F97B9E